MVLGPIATGFLSFCGPCTFSRGFSEMSCIVMITTRGSEATPLTKAPNWW
jgi:hypothetical protein